MWPDVERAEAEAKRFEGQIADANKVKAQAQTKVSQANNQMQGSEQRLTDLKARLQQLQASGSPIEQQQAVEKQIDDTNKLIAQWQGEVLAAQMTLDESTIKIRAIAI